MYSFVIWDDFEEKLFVCRDRFGIKPIYSYEDNKFLIFSSEIKSIKKFNSFEHELNQHNVYKYLARGWLQDTDTTFYKNINSFPKGNYFFYKNDKSIIDN